MAITELVSLLNVVIALVFILIALSLFASLAVEAIAGTFAMRGRMLRRRILAMLDDPEEAGFARLLLRSPLVEALSSGGRFPSYIPEDTFALAVISVMRERGLEAVDDLPRPLRAVALATGFGTEAERDAFRLRVEVWYDQTMERLTGAYRRWARRWLFAVGFLLAVALNADMISMTRALWENRAMLGETVERIEALQSRIADAAAEAGQTPGEFLEGDAGAAYRSRLAELIERDEGLSPLELPFGWALEKLECRSAAPDEEVEARAAGDDGDRAAQAADCAQTWLVGRLWHGGDWSAVSVLGWLLTALALMPGTSFWFDVLAKLLQLRAAGVKPRAGRTPRAGDAA